jgi:hypothetical protein
VTDVYGRPLYSRSRISAIPTPLHTVWVRFRARSYHRPMTPTRRQGKTRRQRLTAAVLELSSGTETMACSR